MSETERLMCNHETNAAPMWWERERPSWKTIDNHEPPKPEPYAMRKRPSLAALRQAQAKHHGLTPRGRIRLAV